MSQTLRLRLDYLLLYWFQQPACTLRLVPLFQQRGQSREEFLLLIVHAATVQLMGFRVPANGQAIHESLPEIILVCSQHRFQGIVQKLEILFQLGKVTPEIISNLLPTTHTQKISASTTTSTGTNIASA